MVSNIKWLYFALKGNLITKRMQIFLPQKRFFDEKLKQEISSKYLFNIFMRYNSMKQQVDEKIEYEIRTHENEFISSILKCQKEYTVGLRRLESKRRWYLS